MTFLIASSSTKRFTWGRRVLPQVLLYLLIPLTATAQAQTPYLVVAKDDAPLIELELTLSPHWHLAWNHSVSGFTVRDYYRWDGSNMLLVASFTPDFAAGLGHTPDRGRLMSSEAGYWIVDIDEAVPDNHYLLRVGSDEVNHRIVHRGVSYSLTELAANTRVRIEVIEK